MADLGDMDAILDQALDDLESTDTLLATDESSNDIANDSSTANVGNAGNDIQGNPSLTTSDNAEESSRETPGDDEPLDPKEFLKYLIEGGDEDLGEEDREAKLDEFMKNIQSKLQDEAESPSSSAKESSSKAEGAPGVDDDDDVAATLASILEQMTTIDDKEDPFNQEGDFPAGNFNPDDIVDGMMEQLLSKDLMYEPMKQVADRYPAWLEANTDNLPETDLERYV
jgi:peroxin-19